MTEPGRTAVIVLAAGAGTRMKSKTPKILHAIGGRTLVGHALTGAAGIDPDFLVAVVSHERVCRSHAAEAWSARRAVQGPPGFR